MIKLWLRLLLSAALTWLCVNTVYAAEPTDEKVEVFITTAKRVYSPHLKKARCFKSDDQDEIKVCAPDQGEQWRVPQSDNLDSNTAEGRRNLDGNIPSPPNVNSLPDCSRGCIGMGHVPPPIYYVDMTKWPTAPPGSDAEKIAKGEIPAP